MWLNQQPFGASWPLIPGPRRRRTVRLSLPPTHVPLFHAWRP